VWCQGGIRGEAGAGNGPDAGKGSLIHPWSFTTMLVRLTSASALHPRPQSPDAGRSPLPRAAAALAGAILFSLMAAPSPAPAQEATPKAATPKAPTTAAAPAAPGGAAKKTPVLKNTKAGNRKKSPEPVAEPDPVVADADEQQLLAAKEVLVGESGCEFDQKIQVDANPKHPGYVDMSFNKKKYMMKPVMSSTGALRLEDVRSETLMIQISSKTMLMNQKTGQRLVDNCVHPDQKVTAADAEQVLMK
jgi:hypothetical protein